MTDATPTPAPSPAPSKKAKKPLWRRILKWTFRAVVLLIVLGIAAYAITTYWAAKTIHNEITRIRAAGEPVTFTDLAQLTPQVAEHNQDAGPYYAAACELVDNDFFADDKNSLALYNTTGIVLPVAPEALALAHRDLDQNRIPLDLLDRGAALSGCSWDIQLQYGIAVSVTRIDKPRALLDAGSLRTRVLAVEGHGDQAIDSAVSELGLLRMCDRQPVLIDGLVQIAMLARACQDASIAMDLGHPSDAALQKLGDALVRTHLVEPRQLFIAERVYYLEVMRYVIANSREAAPDGSDGPAIPERETWTHLGLMGRVMVAKGLPMYARYITAATGDFPGILTASDTVSHTPANFEEEIIGPSLGKAMLQYARSLSMYRSTLIALQIERFRRALNGTLPDTLSDLPNAKDFPTDPFTGNALLYIKTPDGYCVMSAGRNHAEDDSRHIDRDKDPVGWSQRWGIHIRTSLP